MIKTVSQLERKFKNRLKAMVRPSSNLSIRHVSSDSKRILSATAFCALAGAKTHGGHFVAQAVKAGAKVILVEPPIEPKIFAGISRLALREGLALYEAKNLRSWLNELANWVYDDPSRKINLVAVTGTSGKTTVNYLMESIARAAGWRVGVLGTVNNRIDGQVFPATLTTPQPDEIIYFLDQMLRRGCRICLMEATSQAIDLGRLNGLNFDAAVFNNLSRDHLDHHGTMERYYLAKEKLFTRLLAQSSKKNKLAVINVDDVWGMKLWKKISRSSQFRSVMFGQQSGSQKSARVKILKQRPDLLELEFDFSGEKTIASSRLIGSFNVSNMLAAATACRALGIAPKAIAEGIFSLAGVPGRLEKVSKPGETLVVVDYAHKPEALRNVLKTLRGISGIDRIIVVMGCGGDRDPGKRPIMGAIAVKLANLAIFTSDNPRSENPIDIVRAIESGARMESRQGFVSIVDRYKAIGYAIAQAKIDDCVLVAGKGHEAYQIFRDRTIDFDDRLVARSFLDKKFLAAPQS